MKKWPVQKLKHVHRTAQKHVQHHDSTDISKKLIFVTSIVNIIYSLKLLLSYEKVYHLPKSKTSSTLMQSHQCKIQVTRYECNFLLKLIFQ